MSLTIEVKYHDFEEKEKAAFQRAVNTWAKTLDSAVPVKVEAYWDVNLGGGLTAMCVPNGIINFGKGTKSTWYTSPLADKLCGKDLQQEEADMAVFFDSNFDWNASEGNPTKNQLDLESVALHEMCHGFGFLGLFWVDPISGNGSYGNDNLLGVIPEAVRGKINFIPKSLKNYPSAYGRNIVDGSFKYLTKLDCYTNGSSQLGTVLKDGTANFNLPTSTQYKVYTDNKFTPFTSIEHLDPKEFPRSLMRPSISKGEFIRTVDEPVKEILKTLDW